MLPPSRSNEGYRLLNQGLLAEAEAEFRNALQGDPRDVKCLLGLARTLLATESYDEALTTLAELFKLRPDNLEGKSLRGSILVARGDPAGVKDLEDAARDRRAGPAEHLNLGLYLAEKDDARAQKEFELALRVDNRNSRAHLELARIAERRGDYRNAVVKYQKACEFAAANDGQPFVLLSRAHYALGETTAGSQAMLEALNRANESQKRQWLDEGFTLAFDAREFQAAFTIAVTGLELEPDNATYQAWRDQAQAASQQAGVKGKPSGPTELWQEAPTATRSGTHSAIPSNTLEGAGSPAVPNPTNAPVTPEDFCTHAEAQLINKSPPDIEGALKLLDQALAINPKMPKANLNKALALAMSRQFALALQYAQKVQATPNANLKAEAEALIAKCQEKLRR